LVDEAFWLDVLRDSLPAMREALARFIVADRVALRDASEDWERLALEGPGSPAVLAAVLGESFELAADACSPAEVAGVGVWICAAGYTAAARQLYVPAGRGASIAQELLGAGAALGLIEASGEALEILRIEAGVPKLGVELDESVLPAEAGLEHAISFTKGCYTGQEIVARLESRGKPGHRLVGLSFEAGACAAVGAEIVAAERAVGELTSACTSPAAGAIGLGFVRAANAEPGSVLQVGTASARVTALPFIP
jgi:folate-binding protein YgfZ